MKKQNLLVLGVIILLIAAVAVVAAVMPQKRTISEEAPSLPAAEETQSPAEETAPAKETAPESTVQPPEAYLVLTVRSDIYEPIALTGEGSFTIKQSEEMTNTVHVTRDSVWMEHSTCDNQDCVDQGIVSLENMEKRVLSNMIICLPNEVVLELHTPESLATVFGLQE